MLPRFLYSIHFFDFDIVEPAPAFIRHKKWFQGDAEGLWFADFEGFIYGMPLIVCWRMSETQERPVAPPPRTASAWSKFLKKVPRETLAGIVVVGVQWGDEGKGKIVNALSSKAGMVGMSKSLAHEVASRGITVNCVAPTMIETDLIDAVAPETLAMLLAKIPMGRIGTPTDIGHAVVFLASPEAEYINGVSLTVNEVDGNKFGINIIPHTQQVTTLGEAKVGDRVNLEVDVLARYVARLKDIG